ncbi:MAG TPA: GNAT family N-acetyltransferase [Dongiaceae bacterium]|nr:GNAT family N-acetyltransferase [Dongiaceae bacterium]
MIEIRPADPAEVDRLARLWHDAWHETHAPLVPAALVDLRTPAGFRDRLQAAFPDVFAAGPPGALAGFYVLKDDELCHLFVSPAARGSGLAATMVADAEARLAARGVEVAWLVCMTGNHRAARFYEKCGWRLTGTVSYSAETSAGPFPLDHLRYEKMLTSLAR